MFDLSGKVALVTGASGSIGAAIAKSFAERGAKIVVSGTRQDKLNELVAEIGQDKANAVICDLGNVEDVENLFSKAEAAFGQVDILVNNAGVTRDNLMMRLKDEDWQTTLDVNLTSCFRLCRSAVKSMMKRRYGRIINITSIVGVTGNPGQTNYAASKAGMIGLSKSLAQEVATRGITVNCIAPGFIASPMTDKLPHATKEKITASIPAGYIGKPEDIASAAVYLSSDEAGYTTGQTIHVNGGMAMI